MTDQTPSPEAMKRFLREAARYFEKRPTGGEDMAFWSNVTNAENCRKAAELIETQATQVAALREALERITDLSKHQRSGGADPEDLPAIDDALSAAIDIASTALADTAATAEQEPTR